jgi:hypothetical protein
MKKILLSLALLSGAYACAQVTIDTALDMNGGLYKRSIARTIAFEKDAHVVDIYENDLHLNVAFENNENDNGLRMHFTVYAKNGAGLEEIVASPVMVVEWEKEGVLTFGNNDGSYMALRVTPHNS